MSKKQDEIDRIAMLAENERLRDELRKEKENSKRLEELLDKANEGIRNLREAFVDLTDEKEALAKELERSDWRARDFEDRMRIR